jgi:transcriptional regulator with XRE-family HTH domain
MKDIDIAQLKALRRERKVKLDSLALRAGRDPASFTRLEKGKRAATEKDLEVYAAELEMPPDELLARITIGASFTLHGEIVAFITGPIWEDRRINHAAKRDRTRLRKVQEGRSECAIGADQLRELLAQFVNDGTEAERPLQLVLQMEPYHSERLYTALVAALDKDCPVLYASPNETLRGFPASHLQLKLRLALADHLRAVQHAHKSRQDSIRELFASRTIGRSPLAVEQMPVGGQEQAREGDRIDLAPNYDIGHWRGHSIFVAMPEMLGSRAGAGFIAPIRFQPDKPFDLHAHFLRPLASDLEVFSWKTELPYWKRIRSLEPNSIDRQLVQPVFHSLIRPPENFEPSTGEAEHFRKHFGKDANAIIDERSARARIFWLGMENRRFRQVCSGAALSKWVQTGQRSDLGPAARSDKSDYADVRRKLAAAKDLLERYHPRFEIAIADQYEHWTTSYSDDHAKCTFSWTSCSGDLAVLERQELDEELGETRVLISNGSIYRHFVGWFNKKWDELKRPEKDTRAVLNRIDQWLAELDQRRR